ncbi:hypothetical protein P0082_09010 [Candidatus Haliotispira prima]|uniref:Uncharacterized protein n=1 Tax=Candidatus Haliotispira prima TaxID=3034016 RepID=A0ABY8MF57_9SPIO|nr:hypothetical protein P0082_09010 [Candidatus Haliotispira prima]
MTDVDSKSETPFNVSVSTTFVGATQALVSLTPNKSGAAAFLAVADTETIPSAIAAKTLLAYRNIDFSGTSAQIIQFALSISATQDATGGDVLGGTAAILQPSTAYKIVMYSSGNSTTLLTFTTLGHLAEGYTFNSLKAITFEMSAHNFRTETDGRFQVPFIFSWVVVPAGPVAGSYNELAGGARQGIGIATLTDHVVSSGYADLANVFGNSARGALFLHTPLRGAGGVYVASVSNNVGRELTIIYNQGKSVE